MKLSVRPLRPDDWPVLETLFGANGACGGCWCMAWRQTTSEYEEKKGAVNRRAFRYLVSSGAARGCLAFAADEPVGWCSVGPRVDFSRLERSRVLQTDWDEHTWSVTCFFVKRGWRDQGVARALLRNAVDLARSSGARRLEGYPVLPSAGFGGRMPAAFAWVGVPALFERCGFRDVTPPGQKRPIYVRALRPRVGRATRRQSERRRKA